MAHARTAAAAGLALVAAVAVGGCSGGGSHAGSASTGSSVTSGGGGAQPNPAPTESNPPGDIPDNQAYVPFRPASGFNGFTVKVPEGWARTEKGSTTVFTDKLNTVRVTTARAPAVPTASLVTNKVVPQLRSQVPKFAHSNVSEVTRHSGRVVRLTYQGDSVKDPVTGKVVRDAFERYAFFRQGHEVDLTLSGPVNADNVDPWRIVSDSFTWQ
ncbi:hypothetical protein ACWGDS_02730 [Streptomyces sp. NPDC055059]|jgi:hypothetical protein|uniref:hypothetical protein n=1 Tax=unclassified Streptomyces TaxID=2593676 RepID=UPI002250F76B|nr:hypothetical protein [Streptomyces sp. NBC_00120]MCX5319890.1 hypothetical protein [Streptomyces sp. NBC_00120]